MKCRCILPSAVWCQHISAGHSVTPILSQVPPSCCASPLHTQGWIPCSPGMLWWSLLSPPVHAGSMRGWQRFHTSQVYKVVAILALLWPGISGSHALFIQLLWSNKSQKCVFIGFVVCLSLITFLCVLAGLFYFSDWQWPPGLLLHGLLCWGVFVDLWKWFSKNNIWSGQVTAKCRERTYQQHLYSTDPAIWFLVKANTLKGLRLFCFLHNFENILRILKTVVFFAMVSLTWGSHIANK